MEQNKIEIMCLGECGYEYTFFVCEQHEYNYSNVCMYAVRA